MLKTARFETKICVVGSHVSALPIQVLKTELAFDFVLCNEGVYALRNLLSVDLKNENEIKKHPFEPELPQRVFHRDGSVGDW